MKVISLQSGSNGNSIYVEAGGVRLLFDAGISGSVARQRLADQAVDICSVDALFISHEHTDHVKCMGVFQRKFGLPIHITKQTLTAARVRYDLGDIDDIQLFNAGTTVRIGKLAVETIPTAHDAVDGVVFVIDDGRRRLGILTDLGHVFGGLDDVVSSLHAVILESNYDPAMLDGGPYPEFLKQRIRGPAGHLSNVEAAELLACSGRKLKWACLAHLSEKNNQPKVAKQTHRELLRERIPIRVANRYEATDVLEV
ncbi:MAG: MBL fold metallo-hydrolase [Planctomycetota bacterium]|nr:MBL fold metallo-hydrolase [Planctomycetota bacterium]